MSDSIPIILTAAGRTNTPPATINAEIIAGAAALSPGYTVLPAGLIDDVSSTDTAAVVLCDQAVTETIGSLTPYGANAWLLVQLAQIYLGQGSTIAPANNTAVYCVFTGSAPGIIIAPGFTVSDGTNQYVTPDGGITQTGNSSAPIYFVATQPGSWAVPANTVTQLVTSVPSAYALTVTNPLAGTPGGAAQTEGQFRAQVLRAGLVASTGMPFYLRTLLQAISGVQAQLISIRTPAAGKWEIIVGGTGDPYAIGAAIFQAIPDVSTLVGSTLGVSTFTAAANGAVTTTLNHGYATGQAVAIAGATPSAYNGTYTITVLTETTFEVNVNTSAFSAYVSGGVVTPNFRNTSVTISQYPDSYTIPIVLPPAQTVSMTVTWQTSSSNFVSPIGIAALAQPALAAYINSLPVGAPINVLELNSTFIAAVAGQVPQNLLTVLIFSVAINGITTAPGVGTETIFGDPESYFSCSAASITVVQG
jgi:hypothetical protein